MSEEFAYSKGLFPKLSFNLCLYYNNSNKNTLGLHQKAINDM